MSSSGEASSEIDINKKRDYEEKEEKSVYRNEDFFKFDFDRDLVNFLEKAKLECQIWLRRCEEKLEKGAESSSLDAVRDSEDR